jgi:hypothetical protein
VRSSRRRDDDAVGARGEQVGRLRSDTRAEALPDPLRQIGDGVGDDELVDDRKT